MQTPDLNFLLRNPLHLLAFGFASGLSPKAPGTVGTVAAIPLWYLMTGAFNGVGLFGVILAAFVFGIWICAATSKALGVHDHGGIVWDEFVGLWLTLFFLPQTITATLIGFLFFRLFDIWKPWPIRLFDKHVHGGLGIMLDDVLAALPAAGMSLAVLHLFILL